MFQDHNERVLIDKLFERCQINIKNASEQGEFHVYIDTGFLDYKNENTAKKVIQNVINKLIKDGYSAEEKNNLILQISWDKVKKKEKGGFKFPLIAKLYFPD